ncbi:Flavin reductase domain protein FMN-binding protein [Devosia sp. LC5]|uniref:flavin reductase family protein n=1 Tax=Devosia sp. LC5 TaxID=1502724 RepID=UPI0004E3C77E|nr:flavin reductase family protein [Devosia sp. LC5]KFC66216.1 Flavin reductase domain protein FMN-binding protein [Devosia sp. LC5]
MEIDPTPLAMRDNYKLMTGLIVPRPIAWVSTLSENGQVNLAPFSAFTFVSHKPPMLAISIGRRGTELKDTGNNILRTGEFVVNIGNLALLEPLHLSSAHYPSDESEVEALGLETAPSSLVAPPRLADAPASLECRLNFSRPFGDEENYLMVGEVLRFHIKDHLVNAGKVETRDLDPVARLGGPKYATLGEIVIMPPALVVERVE